MVRLTLSLGLIKHHPAHIFNILHVLSLKEFDDVADDFFLNPDEDESIDHEKLGEINLTELLHSYTTML